MTAARRDHLRIAFVADTFRSSVATSGGVFAAGSLVERLRRNHEVIIVGADAEGPGSLRLPGFQIPIHAMQAQHFVMARPMNASLSELFSNVDIVHLQFPFWLSFASVDIARSLGRPASAGFHVQPGNLLRSVGIEAPWLESALYRFWVQRLYNRADLVVCPSRFAARKLTEHGLTAPSLVATNGVPADIRAAPLRRSLPSHGFLVMSVGRLAAEKRQSLLLRAVARSRHREHIRLVIAGKGPMEQTLQADAARLGVPAEIGFLPREQLIGNLGSADLVVHCSDVELEGIAVLEAMGMGAPVLVADSPESAAADFAVDDRFRFPAGDVAALTARMDALLDDSALLQRASAQVRLMAAQLDADDSARKIEQAWFALLGRSPAVAPSTELGTRN